MWSCRKWRVDMQACLHVRLFGAPLRSILLCGAQVFPCSPFRCTPYCTHGVALAGAWDQLVQQARR